MVESKKLNESIIFLDANAKTLVSLEIENVTQFLN